MSVSREISSKSLKVASIAHLVAWIFLTFWGVIFVDKNILDTSVEANLIVQYAVDLLPWLSNINNLGKEAQRALYLYCLSHLLFVPLTCWYSYCEERREFEKDGNMKKVLVRATVSIFGVGMFIVLYLSIAIGSWGISRVNKLIFINEVASALTAPFFAIGFWLGLAGFLINGYFIVLIYKKKGGSV